MHSECGLTFQDLAQYTDQEIARLRLGFIVRNELKQTARESAASGGSRSPSVTARKRELKRGQQQARSEMLADVGV